MTYRHSPTTQLMPWDRPLPAFDECDGWRICTVCGTSWNATVRGFDFAREWRHHLYQHMRDRFPNEQE